MIQRIQTIFLLLAALAIGGMLKFPMASTATPGNDVIFADAAYTVQDHPVLLGLTILGALMAVVAMFLFKKRAVQMRLGYLVIVVCIVIPVVAYLYFTNQSSAMSAGQAVNDGLGMFLPLIGIVFIILANRFIKKDDNIVKSMDRLR